jgi:hypothetical protein
MSKKQSKKPVARKVNAAPAKKKAAAKKSAVSAGKKKSATKAKATRKPVAKKKAAAKRTAAKKKTARASSRKPAPLKGVSDIRRFFHRNETPIYFISATNFNLLGADEWIKGFKFITYIDCFDGLHPNLMSPQHRGAPRGVPEHRGHQQLPPHPQRGDGVHRQARRKGKAARPSS